MILSIKRTGGILLSELRATALIDNLADGGLLCEWGLAVHIEYRGESYLLDTGATGKFADNASLLGIDLANVSAGVLSHAHYDHSDGMERFFAENAAAKFYIREGAAENCYGSRFIFSKYIGIKRGMLEKFADRIEYVSGDKTLSDGVYLIPHKTPGLENAGKKAGMFRKVNGRRVPEDFSHEQSLVFDTEKGLVIFNSCSHGGADNIIREISATFPDKKIYALIGGFHLFRSSDRDILTLAENVKKTGIERIVTGHCTGDRAFDLLKRELGEKAEKIHSGFIFEV